jgi:hypothetical protein
VPMHCPPSLGPPGSQCAPLRGPRRPRESPGRLGVSPMQRYCAADAALLLLLLLCCCCCCATGAVMLLCSYAAVQTSAPHRGEDAMLLLLLYCCNAAVAAAAPLRCCATGAVVAGAEPARAGIPRHAFVRVGSPANHCNCCDVGLLRAPGGAAAVEARADAALSLEREAEPPRSAGMSSCGAADAADVAEAHRLHLRGLGRVRLRSRRCGEHGGIAGTRKVSWGRRSVPLLLSLMSFLLSPALAMS